VTGSTVLNAASVERNLRIGVGVDPSAPASPYLYKKRKAESLRRVLAHP
jgi:hypothetical protein